MLDPSMRFVIAYGLTGFLVLAAAAFVWWRVRNTQYRRDARARAKLAEYYRRRDEAAGR